MSNGVVGSAAFAAYDAGFDVWLGNSRSNAPRLHLGALRDCSAAGDGGCHFQGLLDVTRSRAASRRVALLHVLRCDPLCLLPT